jgi:hypothetical protein
VFVVPEPGSVTKPRVFAVTHLSKSPPSVNPNVNCGLKRVGVAIRRTPEEEQMMRTRGKSQPLHGWYRNGTLQRTDPLCSRAVRVRDVATSSLSFEALVWETLNQKATVRLEAAPACGLSPN